MNRRDLLKAAPVSLAVGVLPAFAAAGTPVMTLFREWSALHNWLHSEARRGMPDAEFDVHLDHLTALEDRILATPARSADDVVAKVAAYSCFGEIGLPDTRNAPAFWAEVRHLLGGEA